MVPIYIKILSKLRNSCSFLCSSKPETKGWNTKSFFGVLQSWAQSFIYSLFQTWCIFSWAPKTQINWGTEMEDLWMELTQFWMTKWGSTSLQLWSMESISWCTLGILTRGISITIQTSRGKDTTMISSWSILFWLPQPTLISSLLPKSKTNSTSQEIWSCSLQVSTLMS